MILHSIKLKNFMKHEDLTVDFASGLNLIRSPNEGGKSTILFGISYNFFGSTSLPQSLDDTTTWNAPKNSMKTTVEFSVEDQRYMSKRSASGAELYKLPSESPLAVGHRETSEVIATLLDLPSVAAASSLLVANQNDIRGVISLGATAAAAFIEELIDMREIDDMIKDVSEKITHSSDAKKQAVASADAAAEQLEALEKPTKTGRLKATVKKLEKEKDGLNESVAEVRREATDLRVAEQTSRSQLATAKALLSGLVIKIDKAYEGLRMPVAEDTVTDKDVSETAKLLAETQAYDFYVNDFFPYTESRPETEWEGSFASFTLYMESLTEKQERIRNNISDLKIAIAESQSRIITETTCPTCGQEICDVDEAEAGNQIIKARVVELQRDLSDANDDFAEYTALIQEAKQLLTFDQKQRLWVAQRPLVIETDTNFVPSRIAMLNGIPEQPSRRVTQVEFNELCVLRDKHKAMNESYNSNKAEYDKLKREEEVYQQKIIDLTTEHEQHYEAMIEVEELLRTRVEELEEVTAEVNDKRRVLDNIEMNNKRIEESRVTLEDTITKWRTTAEDIQRNSGLISALRAARLEISALLWQKLLGVTENYFSIFRGQPSTLSMSKKGILVDGHLSAPSGSTLDVLGLALRLAMSKLFANNGLCSSNDRWAAGCGV